MSKENMKDNFNMLTKRVFKSLSKTDLEMIKNILTNIKEPTLVSGVGGSNVVSNFLAKVLSKKNNIVCESITPRDIIYRNLNGFKNIISCSYRGNNYGVKITLANALNKYLFSKNQIDGVTNINYYVENEENSFISLSSTLIPMTIALIYYCDDLNIVEEILKTTPQYKNFFSKSNVFEILSGYETSTATRFLETTMTEAGLFAPVVHDKYDYCHGRSNLNFESKNNLIFFDNDTELDKYYKEILKEQYSNIISLKRKYTDNIINDYYLTYNSMWLCKSLAESLAKDLSLVKYSPLVKKLYKYQGEM